MKALYKNPIVIILIVVTIAVFVYLEDDFQSIDLSNLTPTNIIAVLGYLSVIILIVEQFIEIFAVDPNEKNKIECKNRIAEISKEMEKPDMEVALKDSLTTEKKELEGELITKGLKRKQKILIINFGIGLLLAFAGFRIISGFLFDGTINTGTSEPQRVLIQSIDIILTAGIIAGGSDRMHRLIKRIKKNFDSE